MVGAVRDVAAGGIQADRACLRHVSLAGAGGSGGFATAPLA